MSSSQLLQDLEPGTTVGSYEVVGKIGKGSFGQLYLVTRNGEEFAMKMALKNSKARLEHEYNLCRVWHARHRGTACPARLPKAYFYAETDNECFMVMELLGSNLGDLIQSQQLTQRSHVHLLARYLIRGLEQFHQLGWVHCDMKPDNIMFFHQFAMDTRVDEKQLEPLYLIDFGLSRQYMKSRSVHKSDDRKLEGFKGTLRYSSINTHERSTQTRRDDIESLLYVLLACCYKTLPWQDALKQMVENTDEEKEQAVYQLKLQFETLFSNETVFVQAWRMIRQLQYADTPDYDALIQLFS